MVEHAHAVHVVVEVAPGALVVALRKEAFAGVPEGRVPHVVSQRDGFYQVGVQPQQAANAAGYARNQLHVQPTPGDVVVGHEREHLRLPGVAVVGRHVDYLLDVAHKGGPGERGAVVLKVEAPHDVCVVEAEAVALARQAVGAYGLLDFGLQGHVGYFAVGFGCHRGKPLILFKDTIFLHDNKEEEALGEGPDKPG